MAAVAAIAAAGMEADALKEVGEVVSSVIKILGHDIKDEIGYLLGKCCWDLKQKERPLIIVIVNKTTEKIMRTKVNFHHGRFWKDVAEYAPGSTTVLMLANEDGRAEGCTGEMHFTSKSKQFVLGFANPGFGSYKAMVKMGAQKEDAVYDEMENDTAQADTFFATTWDTTKKPATFGVVLRGW